MHRRHQAHQPWFFRGWPHDQATGGGNRTQGGGEAGRCIVEQFGFPRFYRPVVGFKCWQPGVLCPVFADLLPVRCSRCDQQAWQLTVGDQLREQCRPALLGTEVDFSVDRFHQLAQLRDTLLRGVGPGLCDQHFVKIVRHRCGARQAFTQFIEDVLLGAHRVSPDFFARCSRAISCSERAAGLGALWFCVHGPTLLGVRARRRVAAFRKVR